MKRIAARQQREIARNRERVPPEDQPWRCANCNTPIDPGLRMPCKCPGFGKDELR